MRYERERDNLQKNYAKGLIPRSEFLVSMGGLTLKGAASVQKLPAVTEPGAVSDVIVPPSGDSDTDDSLR